MSKLYTTYLAKMKKLFFEKSSNYYFIARYKPATVKLSHLDDVAPSPHLLGMWKLGEISWEEFEKEYYKELDSDSHQVGINIIVRNIEEDEDVWLICYEKDNKHCHRRLLAEYIKDKYGIEWEEM